ncbi:unnamed protein product [Effrenium voratum]|nr:unnamed protein product [Effrenium voratum]
MHRRVVWASDFRARCTPGRPLGARRAEPTEPQPHAAPSGAVPLLRCVALAVRGSVRSARRLVAKSRVYVDGARAQDELAMVPNSSTVTILKKRVQVEAPPRSEYYLKMHKPWGVVCSHAREAPDARIVSDLYPSGAEGCHTVGRLDRRSTGLLLFTSDGFFSRSVAMPETHIEKEYVAVVSGIHGLRPDEAVQQQLLDGVDLEDGKAPAAAKVVELLQDDATGLAQLRLVVSSGRYHLVRRMMRAVGFHCEQLLRTRIGTIRGVRAGLAREEALEGGRAQLGDGANLQPGQYAAVTAEEVASIYRAAFRSHGMRRSKFSTLRRRRELSKVLCAIAGRSCQKDAQEFSKVLHTFGTDTSNLEERRCVSRDAVREPFVSPFKHIGSRDEESHWMENRSPVVGRKFSNAEVLGRARRVIISAKAHREIDWDKVFLAADVDKSGALDLKELKQVMRVALRISPQTLPDYDIQVLFEAIDQDGSGSVEMSELLEYVCHGSKRPDDDQELFRKKTARVRRNLNLAFRKYTASHAAINELFANMDAGGDGKVSLTEFMYFARINLRLTQYDVGDMELKQFYRGMDHDGDGVDAEELLNFIKEQHAELSSRKVFSFADKDGGGIKKEPWKQRNPFDRGNCLESPSSVFVNLGRIKPPPMRLAVASR